jgi:hypothetical protein
MTHTTDTITVAARWLVDNWHVAPQPITRTIREQFGLGFNDAVKVIVEARRIMRGHQA